MFFTCQIRVYLLTIIYGYTTRIEQLILHIDIKTNLIYVKFYVMNENKIL